MLEVNLSENIVNYHETDVICAVYQVKPLAQS